MTVLSLKNSDVKQKLIPFELVYEQRIIGLVWQRPIANSGSYNILSTEMDKSLAFC